MVLLLLKHPLDAGSARTLRVCVEGHAERTPTTTRDGADGRLVSAEELDVLSGCGARVTGCADEDQRQRSFSPRRAIRRRGLRRHRGPQRGVATSTRSGCSPTTSSPQPAATSTTTKKRKVLEPGSLFVIVGRLGSPMRLDGDSLPAISSFSFRQRRDQRPQHAPSSAGAVEGDRGSVKLTSTQLRPVRRGELAARTAATCARTTSCPAGRSRDHNWRCFWPLQSDVRSSSGRVRLRRVGRGRPVARRRTAELISADLDLPGGGDSDSNCSDSDSDD